MTILNRFLNKLLHYISSLFPQQDLISFLPMIHKWWAFFFLEALVFIQDNFFLFLNSMIYWVYFTQNFITNMFLTKFCFLQSLSIMPVLFLLYKVSQNTNRIRQSEQLAFWCSRKYFVLHKSVVSTFYAYAVWIKYQVLYLFGAGIFTL